MKFLSSLLIRLIILKKQLIGFLAGIGNAINWAHPPVDWEKKIDDLALKVKKLSKLIGERKK